MRLRSEFDTITIPIAIKINNNLIFNKNGIF
jgi:hypothetical protein